MMTTRQHFAKSAGGAAGHLCIGAAVILVAMTGASLAQLAMPAAKPLSGEKLFQRQCATCHTLNTSDPQRQGPTLAGVYGRKVGSIAGFSYSPGFAKADWSWDTNHLDAWLTNPQAMIAGAVMPYRQAKSEIRSAIIAYLKERH